MTEKDCQGERDSLDRVRVLSVAPERFSYGKGWPDTCYRYTARIDKVQIEGLIQSSELGDPEEGEPFLRALQVWLWQEHIAAAPTAAHYFYDERSASEWVGQWDTAGRGGGKTTRAREAARAFVRAGRANDEKV